MELDLNKCQKYKTIQIHVDEKIYTISGIISIDDFQEILNAKKQERTDYRNIVAEIIWRRLLNVENSPRLEQIIALDDRCFLSYINATLEGCPKLQDAFIQLSDEDDVFYRFLNAVDVYWTGTVREIAKMISESLPKIHITQTKQFAELAGSTLEAISKKIQELYRNPIRNLLNTLAEYSSAAQGSKLTPAERQVLEHNYQLWGELGWTINPAMTFDLFDSRPPFNQEQADALAMEYCSSEDIQKLFDKLRKWPSNRTQDLEEAIFSYNNGKYKSCAMMLFAIIDGMSIQTQTEEDIGKTRKFPVGLSAGRNVLKKFKSKADDNGFLLVLRCKNLVACMEKMFEFVSGFTPQPTVINRNFIDHGMYHGIVTSKDCIQLFLFYYNFSLLLRWYNSKTETTHAAGIE